MLVAERDTNQQTLNDAFSFWSRTNRNSASLRLIKTLCLRSLGGIFLFCVNRGAIYHRRSLPSRSSCGKCFTLLDYLVIKMLQPFFLSFCFVLEKKKIGEKQTISLCKESTRRLQRIRAEADRAKKLLAGFGQGGELASSPGTTGCPCRVTSGPEHARQQLPSITVGFWGPAEPNAACLHPRD